MYSGGNQTQNKLRADTCGGGGGPHVLLPPVLPPQPVSPCPSQQKTSKGDWADSTPVKLQARMVSVPGSSGAVLPSFLEFYIGSST